MLWKYGSYVDAVDVSISSGTSRRCQPRRCRRSSRRRGGPVPHRTRTEVVSARAQGEVVPVRHRAGGFRLADEGSDDIPHDDQCEIVPVTQQPSVDFLKQDQHPRGRDLKPVRRRLHDRFQSLGSPRPASWMISVPDADLSRDAAACLVHERINDLVGEAVRISRNASSTRCHVSMAS